MMIEEKLLDQIWVQKALHLLATDNDLYSIMDSAIKKEDQKDYKCVANN